MLATPKSALRHKPQAMAKLPPLTPPETFFPSNTHETGIRLINMPPQKTQKIPVILNGTATISSLDLHPRLPNMGRRVTAPKNRLGRSRRLAAV